MTMEVRELTEMPADTGAIGQKLLGETNRYRVIGDHLPDILGEELFAEMYEATGRRAISPSLLAMVTVFQFQDDVPDREAAEMAVVRLDWKYALHLPLDYTGFDFTDLHYFRQRLLTHDQEALVFDTILAKVKALGFIKKRSKQRTDSIAVVGAVRMLSALETVTETLRTTVRAIRKADGGWAEKVIPAGIIELYVNTRPDYRLTADERKALMEQAGKDGFWLLDQIDGSGSAEVVGLEEVETMRRVWEQRYERVEGKSKLREKMVDSNELIVSPHDPEVRAGEKRGKKWHGEKVHVTETAEEGGPNFITDVTTAKASSGDSAGLAEIREHLEGREVMPGEQYLCSISYK